MMEKKAPAPPPPPPPPHSWTSFTSPSSSKTNQFHKENSSHLEKHEIDPFKEELVNKLSDRNNNKFNLAVEQRRLLPLISSSLSSQQMSASHGYSTCKPSGDRAPFAYSPDVNDPNKRGKLDLSQIKSPIMKRRLMANMRSTDEEDESEGDANNDRRPNTLVDQSSKVYSHNINNRPPTDLPQENYQRLNETVVQYNEPVTFHDYNNCSTSPSSNLSDVEKLDSELTESLNNLTKLVSNLQDDCVRYSNTQPVTSPRVPQVQYHPPQQVMTIYPSSKMNNFERNSLHDPIHQATPHFQDRRIIGDYILSPDSSYFMRTSNDMLHSISPYYGANLELEQTTIASDIYRNRGASSRTFSPQPYGRSGHSDNSGTSYGCNQKLH